MGEPPLPRLPDPAHFWRLSLAMAIVPGFTDFVLDLHRCGPAGRCAECGTGWPCGAAWLALRASCLDRVVGGDG